MAQEEENRYPNVCVPHTPLIREAGQPQDKDTLLRVCLSVPACLPALPGSKQRCAAGVSPPTQTGGASVTINSPGIFWGKRLTEDREEGRGD